MLDFTSSLYLGFEHASWNLPDWRRLTLGKPAALQAIAGVAQVQRDLAVLTGCERVLLGSSTLHLFSDLFAMLARRGITIWIDEATYPIARWGTDRAGALGVPVRRFAYHDATELRRALGQDNGNRPIIVTDGFSPMRGTHAPLRDYASCAAGRNGLLIVDDTQALGIFGRSTAATEPYGLGGGGSLEYFRLRDARVLVVSSLAKAFGAPLAMLGGSGTLVETFCKNSATLVHCSPPCAASIAAAQQALKMNTESGDEARRRLVERVVRFRRRLAGFLATDSLFPVQSLKLPGNVDAPGLHRALLRRGICSVLHRSEAHRGSMSGRPGISFVLTARHLISEIDEAVEILTSLLGLFNGRQSASRRGAPAMRLSDRQDRQTPALE